MFCKKCGAKINYNDNKCRSCGEKIIKIGGCGGYRGLAEKKTSINEYIINSQSEDDKDSDAIESHNDGKIVTSEIEKNKKFDVKSANISIIIASISMLFAFVAILLYGILLINYERQKNIIISQKKQIDESVNEYNKKIEEQEQRIIELEYEIKDIENNIEDIETATDALTEDISEEVH